jgi:hypothetical protein
MIVNAALSHGCARKKVAVILRCPRCQEGDPSLCAGCGNSDDRAGDRRLLAYRNISKHQTITRRSDGGSHRAALDPSLVFTS